MASNESLVWALELDESALTSGANAGADAVEALKESIQGGVEELRAMQAAMRNLKGSALASDETIKGLKDRIAATKATVSGNTLELLKQDGAFKKSVKPVNKLTEDTKKLGTATKNNADALKKQLAPALSKTQQNIESFGPKLGGLLNGMGSLRALVTAGIAAGIMAVSVAMVALAGAVVGATASLLGYAIAQADARRSDLLRLEGLSKVRNHWLEMVTGQRRAADSAGFLQQAIDGVAAGSALSRDRIGEMTSELYRAGLRGGNLKAALEGLAIVESTQGKESAEQFKARALGAAIYGTSIKKLAADVKTRLGGTARAQMLSLDVQQRKMKESISHLFDGIKIEKFLEALSKITELFSQNTAIGRALKVVIETMFQPMIDGIGIAGPLAKKFFQGFVIGALYTVIAILKVKNYLRDMFGGSDFFAKMDLAKTTLYIGMGAFFALAAAIGAVTLALGVCAVAAFVLSLPFILIGTAVGFALTKLYQASKFMADLDWLKAGADIVRGIANGIRGGVGWVAQAMTDLASSAMVSFKKKLGIASPSKVAFGLALNVPKGIAQAQDAGRGMVRDSAARMASASEEGMRAGAPTGSYGAPSGASSARGSAKPSVSVTIENLTIGNGQSEASVKESLLEAVETIFARVAISMGAEA